MAGTAGEVGESASLVSLEDVHHLLIQGSHDGDVWNFPALTTYQYGAETAGFARSLLFVHGANHAHFNSVWAQAGINDANLSSAELPIENQIRETEQQSIVKEYVNAFLRLTLFSERAYRPYLTGEASLSSTAGEITVVRQFSDGNSVTINDFEEDADPESGTYVGVSNSAENASVFTESASDLYFLSGYSENQTLVLGWDSSEAAYQMQIPPEVDAQTRDYSFLSFKIGQIYETNPAYNVVGQDQDLTVELALSHGTVRRVPLSRFGRLPYPDMTTGVRGQDHTKSILATIRVPLSAFGGRTKLQNISAIRLEFDRSASGLLGIDDIALGR